MRPQDLGATGEPTWMRRRAYVAPGLGRSVATFACPNCGAFATIARNVVSCRTCGFTTQGPPDPIPAASPSAPVPAGFAALRQDKERASDDGQTARAALGCGLGICLVVPILIVFQPLTAMAAGAFLAIAAVVLAAVHLARAGGKARASKEWAMAVAGLSIGAAWLAVCLLVAFVVVASLLRVSS